MSPWHSFFAFFAALRESIFPDSNNQIITGIPQAVEAHGELCADAPIRVKGEALGIACADQEGV